MTTGSELPTALRTVYLAMHRRPHAALARHGVTADSLTHGGKALPSDERPAADTGGDTGGFLPDEVPPSSACSRGGGTGERGRCVSRLVRFLLSPEGE